MLKANVEMAKARRICRSKGCEIPKFHNCLVVWTPVSTPDGIRHQKMSYCHKCAQEILKKEIKALREYTGQLADMSLACQMGFVPPKFRRIHRVSVPKKGKVSHMMDGDSLTTLCGRELSPGKFSCRTKSIISFQGEAEVGNGCKRCLAVLKKEGKIG